MKRAPLLIAFAAVASLVLLVALAPDYLPSRGYPLDDAWTQAVYGGALARSGGFAYNPGIPATGTTSLLWSLLLAGPHLLGGTPGTVVLLTKLLGFGLHVAAAIVLFYALGSSPSSSRLRTVGAGLVACHPDLIAAAVSGVEVPLAALAVCCTLLAARRGGFLAYAAVCTLAPWVRWELGLLSLAIPLGLFLRRDRRRLLVTLIAAVSGTAVSFGLMGLLNLAVLGHPLPAMLYAKAAYTSIGPLTAEWFGFGWLLDRLVVADSSLLLTILGVVAGYTLVSSEDEDDTAAATAFGAALLFFAISFVLVPPVDSGAFYYQRYMLPALPLLVGAVPQLAERLISGWLRPMHRTVARVALLTLVVASVVIASITRYPRLANDAHNVDDVQVAMGRALAGAPPADVIWAIHAGAIRYFGSPFVVDLTGPNSPDMLGPKAQAYLDVHAPRYIEIVPEAIGVDATSSQKLEAQHFTPSTPYTVTSSPAMSSQSLARCPPTLTSGEISVSLGTFHFACAP